MWYLFIIVIIISVILYLYSESDKKEKEKEEKEKEIENKKENEENEPENEEKEIERIEIFNIDELKSLYNFHKIHPHTKKIEVITNENKLFYFPIKWELKYNFLIKHGINYYVPHDLLKINKNVKYTWFPIENIDNYYYYSLEKK